MTIQQKREILKQYKYTLIEIDRLLDERAQLRARAKKIGVNSDAVNEELQKADKILINKIDEQIKLQEYIENCIDKLDNQKYIKILKYRYINLCTHKEIAKKMCYCDERYIRKLESNALNKMII